MATKKKTSASKLKVENIECTFSRGGLCAMQAAACQLLEANFQKMKWHHRDLFDREYIVESVTPIEDEEKKFIYSVSLSSDGQPFAPISLFEFLHTFEPAEEFNFEGLH